jgi:hypothetical protein
LSTTPPMLRCPMVEGRTGADAATGACTPASMGARTPSAVLSSL